MKIVCIATQSMDSPNGAGRTLPMAKALQQRGHEVGVIALHHNYGALNDKKPVIEGIPVHYVAQMQVKKTGSGKTYFPAWHLPARMAWATLRLVWALLSTKADVVQVCKAQPMNLIAAWFKKILHRSIVIVDSDDYEALNNRFQKGWQKRIVAAFEIGAGRIADGIIVSTRFMGNFYQNHGVSSKKICRIPHGYDEARFNVLQSESVPQKLSALRKSLSIPDAAPIIVFIGSMSLTCHAIDLLLDAFEIVHQIHPDVFLVLAGGGEDFDFLQKQSRTLKSSTQVQFVGRVARDEVPWYYRLGVFSIDPKRQGELEESLAPLKLVESIASGVPAVAADIGDAREVLGDAAVYYPAGDVSGMAAAMVSLIEKPEMVSHMRQLAQLRKAEFSWDLKAREWESFYRILAGEA